MNEASIKVLLFDSSYSDNLLIQNQLTIESHNSFQIIYIYSLEKLITYLQEKFFDVILLEPILFKIFESSPLYLLSLLKKKYPLYSQLKKYTLINIKRIILIKKTPLESFLA